MNDVIRKLTDSANQIIRGNYGAAQRMFDLTVSETASNEVRNLAETLGLMSVKIEAREMALEQKLEHIAEQNKALKEASRIRADSSFLLCSTILGLSLYSITLKVGTAFGWLSTGSTQLITLGLIPIILFVIGFYIRQHRGSWSTLGLTWKGGWRATRESLLACIPLIFLAIGLKAWLVRQPWTPWFNQPIFNWAWPLLPLIPYALFSIVQECIGRGIVQGILERVLDGKYRGLIAVLTATTLFSVLHLHYAQSTFVATFIAGLLFGWLYRRHQTLVGVSIAHFLLSVITWECLGLIGGE